MAAAAGEAQAAAGLAHVLRGEGGGGAGAGAAWWWCEGRQSIGGSFAVLRRRRISS